MYRFGCLNSGTKMHFSSFLFQLQFNKKYVKVAINDFTMHRTILKRLRRQKCKQKRKIMRPEEVEANEEKCFHSFKYEIDHTNARFF